MYTTISDEKQIHKAIKSDEKAAASNTNKSIADLSAKMSKTTSSNNNVQQQQQNKKKEVTLSDSTQHRLSISINEAHLEIDPSNEYKYINFLSLQKQYFF